MSTSAAKPLLTGNVKPENNPKLRGEDVVAMDADDPRWNEPTDATLYVQAKNVKVGDLIDGVPITHKSVQQEFVWLSTDDGRSMKLAHSYLIPVDRRTA